MADVLRVAKKLPEFYKAIQVHLVEVSPNLRRVQATSLNAAG